MQLGELGQFCTSINFTGSVPGLYHCLDLNSIEAVERSCEGFHPVAFAVFQAFLINPCVHDFDAFPIRRPSRLGSLSMCGEPLPSRTSKELKQEPKPLSAANLRALPEALFIDDFLWLDGWPAGKLLLGPKGDAWKLEMALVHFGVLPTEEDAVLPPPKEKVKKPRPAD